MLLLAVVFSTRCVLCLVILTLHGEGVQGTWAGTGAALVTRSCHCSSCTSRGTQRGLLCATSSTRLLLLLPRHHHQHQRGTGPCLHTAQHSAAACPVPIVINSFFDEIL